MIWLCGEGEDLMKHLIIAMTVITLMSCTPKQTLDEPALGYTLMPAYLDMETVLPEWSTDSVISPKAKDFTSIPIDSGKLVTVYKDTLVIPPGILISEKKAALYTFYKTCYEQDQTKIRILDTLNWTYYHKALDAEKVYQARIKLLEKDVERTWLEKNMIYIGFGCGLITAILTEWAVIEASK
jgi:hypothetical protein